MTIKHDILRVFHAQSNDFLGTAFHISSRYLLTAKHVLYSGSVKIPDNEIHVRGWRNKGSEAIRKSHLYENESFDIAVLELHVDIDTVLVKLAQPDIFLKNDSTERVIIQGFKDDKSDLEVLNACVSSRDGDTNHYIVDKKVSKGMSGGQGNRMRSVFFFNMCIFRFYDKNSF